MAGESARLFVALDLPREVRSASIAWRAPVLSAGEGSLRPVPEEALHVTLCFLGQRPLVSASDIGLAVAAVARDPIDRLSLGDPLWLPRRRPHALALAVTDRDGALARLQGALGVALAAGGWFAPEERSFLPHVTIARVRRGGDPRALARQELPASAPLAFAGEAVTLYRSLLGSGGARYEALTRVPLRRTAE